jgi:hypothetical protein
MELQRCPKCGEIARVVILTKAKVRCVLKNDGTIGEVLSASRDVGTITSYECGGHHIW